MYYVVFGFLYALSLLPLRVLYLLSDFAYFILYYVAGYRKKVVLNNLFIAFPNKTEKERIAIAKKFYLNFTDTFIETIKFMSAGKRFLEKRFTADYTMLDELYTTGRSVQFHLGHNFNWELVNLVFPFHTRYTILVVYLPLKSKIFDRLFKYIRSKQGSRLIAATQMKREMMPYLNEQYLLGLIADQSPAVPKDAYWFYFFGRPTPFLRGPERAARRSNLPVVFCYFTKTKRGFYKGFARLATMHPNSMPEGELTKQYVQFLEEVMTANPEMWLWSHRRWKWEWKPEYGEIRE